MADAEFKPLNIAVLTISDTRGEAEDVSGKRLVEALSAAGHQNAEKAIVKDDIYAIRAVVSRWIADPEVDAVLTTGTVRPRRSPRFWIKSLTALARCFGFYPMRTSRHRPCNLGRSPVWPTAPSCLSCQAHRVLAAWLGRN